LIKSEAKTNLLSPTNNQQIPIIQSQIQVYLFLIYDSRFGIYYYMDGILNVNKPAGMTSFYVVAQVKRLTGERHTGHAGTLDPLATGVLPVCLGQATRVVEYLFDETKTYRAVIELGITTDSYDSAGKVLEIKDASLVSREQIESALQAFQGNIAQKPPMYSAD
jgi:tRNA pseudouridine55 synthase